MSYDQVTPVKTVRAEQLNARLKLLRYEAAGLIYDMLARGEIQGMDVEWVKALAMVVDGCHSHDGDNDE